MDDKTRETLREIGREIAEANFAVAFTGAGISTESGLPDYRGPSGLWKNKRFEELAHIETFKSEPGEFWGFYAQRLAALHNAKLKRGAPCTRTTSRRWADQASDHTERRWTSSSRDLRDEPGRATRGPFVSERVSAVGAIGTSLRSRSDLRDLRMASPISPLRLSVEAWSDTVRREPARACARRRSDGFPRRPTICSVWGHPFQSSQRRSSPPPSSTTAVWSGSSIKARPTTTTAMAS